ncbi:MAG TPA: ABC transporter substrate-binding protein, partial [Armatimonadota bacterium]|nr:ABC transporter substrate-binding protein [Armatimonadota bacterium]
MAVRADLRKGGRPGWGSDHASATSVDAGATTIVLSPPEMLVALGTDQIDGFVAWEPFPSRAEAMGIGRILARSAAIWPGHPCCVLVVDEELRRTRPGDCLALQRAHAKATAFIRDNPEAAVAVAVRNTGMDPGVVREALRHVTYMDIPDVAGEEEYVAFLGKLGYIRIADPKAFTGTFLGNRGYEDPVFRIDRA